MPQVLVFGSIYHGAMLVPSFVGRQLPIEAAFLCTSGSIDIIIDAMAGVRIRMPPESAGFQPSQVQICIHANATLSTF